MITPRQLMIVEAERNRLRITLRDRIAIAAMPEVLRAFNVDIRDKEYAYPPDWREGVAQEAYLMADAMIKMRGELPVCDLGEFP